MNLLLDTSTFLWFITDDSRLPLKFREAIKDSGNQSFLSVVSLWEIIIKYEIGKLILPQAPQEYIPLQRERHGILPLPLDEKSVARLAQLPKLHRDPFDRILICQSIENQMMFLSTDGMVLKYPIIGL